MSQKLRLVTNFELLLHLPLFFYSCLDVAGIAIIVLNYYTVVNYNTREIDEQDRRVR